MSAGPEGCPARELRLNVHPVGAGSHPGAWRYPGADPLAVASIEGYLDVARVAERGKLDAIFLADVPGLHSDLTTYPILNGLEPTLILTAMAVVTERIGLVATASTTFNEPFNIARRLRALDLISHGRAGWNAVTTSDPRVAANFAATVPDSRTRYERAEEFVAVVLDLWQSWQPGAVVADTRSGLYADMSQIRPIGHVGEHFSVRGPISLPPSEQGYPVIFHAGVSPDVRKLTARTGEAMFGAVCDMDTALREATGIRAGAAALGRPAPLLLPGLMTTLGGTEQDALDRRATLDDLAGTDDGVALLAYRLGVSPDMLELDKPVPEVLLGGLGNVTGHARPAAALAGQGLTVRDILHRGGGSGHVQAIGTPDQVASQIEAWHASTAVDGFTVMPDVTVDGLPDFVDHVVPILQRRGLFRTEYRGETLRDHYGLPVPDVAMRRDRQAARA